MSSIATIAAVSTAVVAVASTAYTVLSSSSRSSGGGQQQATQTAQPVTMPDVPATVEPAAAETVPEKAAVADTTAVAPDPSKGVAGTIVTGGLGDTTDTTTKKKTLLGS